MNSAVIIRSIRQGEEKAVCKLIERSFDRFVGCDYSPEGVTEFYKYVNPVAMASRLSGNHFILVAEHEDRLVGMLEFRNNEHLSLMFVEPSYLRRGISRLLFDHALSAVRMANPSAGKISVNSSRYAAPVYESFGFVVSGAENTINGITFIPMNLELRADGS